MLEEQFASCLQSEQLLQDLQKVKYRHLNGINTITTYYPSKYSDVEIQVSKVI
jgi:hypothetical protein